MSKKLNITGITNDLEGSAFFPGKRPLASSVSPSAVPDVKLRDDISAPTTINPPREPKQPLPERANASTTQRPNGRRIITRNSFEIYEDQMESLRKISYNEKMDGKLGSMSRMVRDAIDQYLQRRSQQK